MGAECICSCSSVCISILQYSVWGNDTETPQKEVTICVVLYRDSDTEAVADKMVQKVLSARIFEDQNGKTNLSLADVNGEVLVVSQFTLYADCRKGNRPSFTRAGAPDKANALYEYFMSRCREWIDVVAHGEFGADMKVRLLNDGPFTIMYDSDELNTPRK